MKHCEGHMIIALAVIANQLAIGACVASFCPSGCLCDNITHVTTQGRWYARNAFPSLNATIDDDAVTYGSLVSILDSYTRDYNLQCTGEIIFCKRHNSTSVPKLEGRNITIAAKVI